MLVLVLLLASCAFPRELLHLSAQHYNQEGCCFHGTAHTRILHLSSNPQPWMFSPWNIKMNLSAIFKVVFYSISKSLFLFQNHLNGKSLGLGHHCPSQDSLAAIWNLPLAHFNYCPHIASHAASAIITQRVACLFSKDVWRCIWFPSIWPTTSPKPGLPSAPLSCFRLTGPLPPLWSTLHLLNPCVWLVPLDACFYRCCSETRDPVVTDRVGLCCISCKAVSGMIKWGGLGRRRMLPPEAVSIHDQSCPRGQFSEKHQSHGPPDWTDRPIPCQGRQPWAIGEPGQLALWFPSHLLVFAESAAQGKRFSSMSADWLINLNPLRDLRGSQIQMDDLRIFPSSSKGKCQEAAP